MQGVDADGVAARLAGLGDAQEVALQAAVGEILEEAESQLHRGRNCVRRAQLATSVCADEPTAAVLARRFLSARGKPPPQPSRIRGDASDLQIGLEKPQAIAATPVRRMTVQRIEIAQGAERPEEAPAGFLQIDHAHLNAAGFIDAHHYVLGEKTVVLNSVIMHAAQQAGHGAQNTPACGAWGRAFHKPALPEFFQRNESGQLGGNQDRAMIPADPARREIHGVERWNAAGQVTNDAAKFPLESRHPAEGTAPRERLVILLALEKDRTDASSREQ